MKNYAIYKKRIFIERKMTLIEVFASVFLYHSEIFSFSHFHRDWLQKNAFEKNPMPMSSGVCMVTFLQLSVNRILLILLSIDHHWENNIAFRIAHFPMKIPWKTATIFRKQTFDDDSFLEFSCFPWCYTFSHIMRKFPEPFFPFLLS